MSNRKVNPEKRRIPMTVTIQKHVINKIKEKSENNDMSLSAYIESIIVKDLEK